ncbi:hypothetical protein [Labrenzia sp. PHM005]|uniref:hypothetical protein n=1 Tax=Labrenzia sp. PHM005 TaxID=2590016 RepID=UPI0011404A9C|nr:hypothetical protein [Labrenzia sp. PHM005]QDG76386.1 hypothetical protein FJ695_11165 [Labrenzia sp. PHM005]
MPSPNQSGYGKFGWRSADLATQTSKATENTSQQLSEIQGAISGAVQSIETIVFIVNNLDEVTASIAAAVEEQGAATVEMSSSVQAVAEGAERLKMNIGGVQEAIELSDRTAMQFSAGSRTLDSSAAAITQHIEGFFERVVSLL